MNELNHKSDWKNWGHCTVSLKTTDGEILFQPYFAEKFLCVKRLAPLQDTSTLTHIKHIFVGNPRTDRFDANAFKYFKQSFTHVHVVKSLKPLMEKFFSFKTSSLDENKLIFGDTHVTPIATASKVFRYLKWHRHAFHFLIEHQNERVLLLSEAISENDIFESFIKCGQVDRLIFPASQWTGLPFYKGPSLSWLGIQKISEYLNVQTLTPYAFETYARSQEELATFKNEFSNQMTQLNLISKIKTF